jgi:hypothetical protein
MPDIKPKRPTQVVVFENRYGSDEAITENLMTYDAEVSRYNRERAGDQTANDWAAHILDYHTIEKKKDIETYLKNQRIDPLTHK